jgi:two-component system chemotaxis sensor kinase CheA
VGGQDTIQYRGEIIPLIHVDRVLQSLQNRRSNRLRSAEPAGSDEDFIQVVVYSGLAGRVGLVVGHIIDIVEDSLTTRSTASRPGVAFTPVVQERLTEFLDVEAIIRAASSNGGAALAGV